MFLMLRGSLRTLNNFWTQQPVMATSGFASNSFQVEHDQKKRKFFIKLGSEEALLEYEERPKGILNMYHTEVPVSHRGQGIANILAEAAFKHVVIEDLKMKLSCTFLQKYLRENPKTEFGNRVV